MHYLDLRVLLVVMFWIFFFFRAAPAAYGSYGSSQAWSQIGVVAPSLPFP